MKTQIIFHFKREKEVENLRDNSSKSSTTVKPVLSFWLFDWTIFLFKE
jgi:hypothetical protein